MTHTNEQERAILYKGFCEWCKTVPHLDLDPRLHTHGGRIEDGGYIADTATAKAFAAWQAARRAQVVTNESRAAKLVQIFEGTEIETSGHLATVPQPPEAASAPVGTMCHGKAGELVPQWIMHADGLEIVFGCSCLLYKSERGIEVLRIDSGKGPCIKFGVPDTATEVLQPSGILHFHQTAASFCAEIAGESKSEAAPVQMPEADCFAFQHSDGTWHDVSHTRHSAGMKSLYTEHQVRQLLSAYSITN